MPVWTKEQNEAINKTGKNIIVSAGAGSGKTAVLTERVITKLKCGIHINELLILTFTNNAAEEMKNRIKKKIKEIPELKEELNYIDNASITTFDAFVLLLVKKYARYLNLDKNLAIIDQSIISLEKKKILDDIFNDFYLSEDECFISFVTTFGIKNDKKVKELILDLESKISLLPNKEEFLEGYISNYYTQDNIIILFDKYMSIIYRKINDIKALLTNLEHEIDNDYTNKLYDILNNLFNAENYDEIKNSVVFSIPSLPRYSSDNAKSLKGKITDIYKEIQSLCEESKDELISNVFSTKNNVNIIINIVTKLNHKIMEYKRNVNLFEFNDISMFAIKLLKENENISREMQLEYKEIMIDEYQDTNDVQEAFISLIQQNNVYMVGDIKQSIYRFRNANPYIFKRKYDLYKDCNTGYKIDLSKNFRSRKEVIEGINTIFNYIMDDNIGNANYIEEHQMIFGNSSYDEVGYNNTNNNLSILNYASTKEFSNDEIEAFIIGNDIKKKIDNGYKVFKNNQLTNSTFGDFCILLDRSTSFDVYKKVFEYLQIPLKVYKDENILHNDETYLIKNIIGLVLKINKNEFDADFKYYFTSIARSYLFELNDEEIFNIHKSNSFRTSEIYKKAKTIAINLDWLSNKELIETIINDFEFYKQMITVGDINYRIIVIENILEKVEELNKVGISVFNLIEFFDLLLKQNEDIKIPAMLTDEDSVIITNIHKSKGLEYHICYYSGLYKKFNLRDSFEKIIFSNEFGFILPSFKESLKNTFIYTLFKEKYIEEEISEKIRLFYVSLTRCKEKMIMLTNINRESLNYNNVTKPLNYLEKINYRSFLDMLVSVYDLVEQSITDVDIPEINYSYKYINNSPNLVVDSGDKIMLKNIEIKTESLLKKTYSKTNNLIFTKEDIDNINLGNKIHYILENIDFINPNYENLNNFEKNIINDFLNINIFDNINNAKVFKEYEFINTINQEESHGKIDLMLEYENHIDIIDYKLKVTNDESYYKQLDGYKIYIEKLTNKQVNTYLYSLLDRKLTKIEL